MQKNERTKKKVAAGMIAGITSASVLLGSTFDSPDDVINGFRTNSPDGTNTEKTSDIVFEEAAMQSRDDLKSRFRHIVWKIPVRIRTVLCVPLWLLGTLLISLSDLLFKTAVMPAAHAVLNFFLNFAVLLGITGICIKILFPDLPWSKIFSRRNILLAFIGSVILSLCDLIVPHFWEEYRVYRNISKLLLGMVVILIIMRPFIRKKLRSAKQVELSYDQKTFVI